MLSHLCMIIVVRNISCGKVMLSHACVKNSVHRGGSVCLRRHPPWADQTPPSCAETLWADTAWADTPLGRHSPPDRHPLLGRNPQGRPPRPRDSPCSGRYAASYWDAFLFHYYFSVFIFVVIFLLLSKHRK